MNWALAVLRSPLQDLGRELGDSGMCVHVRILHVPGPLSVLPCWWFATRPHATCPPPPLCSPMLVVCNASTCYMSPVPSLFSHAGGLQRVRMLHVPHPLSVLPRWWFAMRPHAICPLFPLCSPTLVVCNASTCYMSPVPSLFSHAGGLQQRLGIGGARRTCTLPHTQGGAQDLRFQQAPRQTPPLIRKTHQPIPIHSFRQSYKAKSTHAHQAFFLEFKELKEVGKEQPRLETEHPPNTTKNHYLHVLPYDPSRDRLTQLEGEPHSDYIKTNFIPEFIVLKKTLEDFWQLMWEQQGRKSTVNCSKGATQLGTFLATEQLLQQAGSECTVDVLRRPCSSFRPVAS
ncbi:uncharacterized protein LOC100895196 isoform X2 [Callithrix jacchus]